MVGDITLRGEGYWVDRVYFDAFNRITDSQPAYGVFNSTLSWNQRDGNWYASAFIKNIANKTYLGGATVGSSTVNSAVVGVIAPPRTFGLKVGYRL
jgi:iron complex outermembrane receptor protein